jgi:hypothetical protein
MPASLSIYQLSSGSEQRPDGRATPLSVSPVLCLLRLPPVPPFYIDLFFVRARELFVATVEGIQEVMAIRHIVMDHLGWKKGFANWIHDTDCCIESLGLTFFVQQLAQKRRQDSVHI